MKLGKENFRKSSWFTAFCKITPVCKISGRFKPKMQVSNETDKVWKKKETGTETKKET